VDFLQLANGHLRIYLARVQLGVGIDQAPQAARRVVQQGKVGPVGIGRADAAVGGIVEIADALVGRVGDPDGAVLGIIDGGVTAGIALVGEAAGGIVGDGDLANDWRNSDL
jgi:hypothetical protein